MSQGLWDSLQMLGKGRKQTTLEPSGKNPVIATLGSRPNETRSDFSPQELYDNYFFKSTWFVIFLQHQKKTNTLLNILLFLSSIHFSGSVMSNSLWPHESQHARPSRPSPNPRVYSNSSIESVMPSNHLILCHPLLLLPSIFPSIRVFSNESAFCIRWPQYWSFSFSISPSNEYSGLISFRIDWLDLLAVQRTLKSLLQPHKFKSINSSALSFLYSPTFTSIYD